MNSELYDRVYSGVARSSAYRATLADIGFNLPDWVVPLSSLERSTLERIAEEMRVNENDAFVDLACGLGGSALWMARHTGARVVGVDFSEVAIREAARLGRVLEMEARASFVVADATRTGLPSAAFAALMSVDALQFIDAQAAAAEIARILQPGGRAVITTWEALTEVEVPTVVRDYRPYFSAAGLRVSRVEVDAAARAREHSHYRAMLRRSEALRAEMGDAAAPLLEEAESALRCESDPPRLRKVTIVAQKPA